MSPQRGLGALTELLNNQFYFFKLKCYLIWGKQFFFYIFMFNCDIFWQSEWLKKPQISHFKIQSKHWKVGGVWGRWFFLFPVTPHPSIVKNHTFAFFNPSLMNDCSHCAESVTPSLGLKCKFVVQCKSARCLTLESCGTVRQTVPCLPVSGYQQEDCADTGIIHSLRYMLIWASV